MVTIKLDFSSGEIYLVRNKFGRMGWLNKEEFEKFSEVDYFEIVLKTFLSEIPKLFATISFDDYESSSGKIAKNEITTNSSFNEIKKIIKKLENREERKKLWESLMIARTHSQISKEIKQKNFVIYLNKIDQMIEIKGLSKYTNLFLLLDIPYKRIFHSKEMKKFLAEKYSDLSSEKILKTFCLNNKGINEFIGIHKFDFLIVHKASLHLFEFD